MTYKSKILRKLNLIPKIKIVGEYFDKTQKYNQELTKIKNENKINEKCLILKKDKYNLFEVVVSDFATIRILRNQNKKPKVLTTTSLVLYEDKLLLHKRSSNSDTYANYYHLIGGAILPDEDMFLSAKREIFEETKLDVCLSKPLILTQERDTGIIQIVFFAFAKNKRFISNWEGELIWSKYPFKYKLTPLAKLIINYFFIDFKNSSN